MDPYVYPNTHVLKNKLDIKDPTDFATAERRLATMRLYELEKSPIQGNFDFEHLKKIHGYVFQDVYTWAGQTRTVDMRKHTDFCHVRNIEPYGKHVFYNLKKEDYLKGLDPEQFTKRAASFLADINELHPFREGNGRTQREFMRELSLNAGYDLNLNKVPSKLMADASIQAHYGMNSGLENIIRMNLKPLEPTHGMKGPSMQL